MNAQVEYLHFNDAENEGALLRDWAEFVRLRPKPPEKVQFGIKNWLKRATPGSVCEVLHEDGWWDADVVAVRSPDDATHRPPAYPPSQLSAGTKREGEDGKQWVVKSSAKRGDEWVPVGVSDWKATRAGDIDKQEFRFGDYWEQAIAAAILRGQAAVAGRAKWPRELQAPPGGEHHADMGA